VNLSCAAGEIRVRDPPASIATFNKQAAKDEIRALMGSGPRCAILSDQGGMRAASTILSAIFLPRHRLLI
jgi:hypothetical protein